MLRFFAIMIVCFSAAISSMAKADNHFVERKDVQAFINMLVKKQGFDQKSLIKLFSDVKIRPQVIRHINKPLEKNPWHTYQMLFVNEWRIQHGVEFWKKYKTALAKAEKIYGVPASIIVATIGIETKYGQKTGDYRVMDSLTNIAFSDSRRAAYFKRELTEFLLLTRKEKLDPLKIMGSYAGAIGQPQFMPSSYRYYAVNFSGSGKTDLMYDEVDVIGSIANFYKKHGWIANQPVAAQALVIGSRYDYLTRNNKINQPLAVADLLKYGIVPKEKLGDNYKNVKLIELQGRYNKEYWLGFHNFFVIKRYNASDLYAMAIYQLSTYILSLREKLHDA
ncbi:MAG: lytic murein transglycosylase B [Gammaproteobacteria bacterium RIFCSPHIGHO2_12_FULL_45_12]|nr:MAG: lytic murein transglycosylase B [Gammaproteobacteria bacterium RIFCSPHIGHO2_12_FULL_45_12]